MLIRTATALAALLTATTLSPAFALSLNISGGSSVSHSTGSTHANSGSSISLGLGETAGSGVDASLGLDAVLDVTDDNSMSVAAATSASAAATGSVAADVWGNVDLVVNLIESSDWAANSFANLAVTQAVAISVNDQSNVDARATLDAALGVYASEISELQVALAANASLSAWLDAQGIDINSVIAADVTAEGSLDVYTD